MKYATASAFRAALEQRLLTMAQQRGVPLVRLRKLVVFDRLMARLMVVAPNRWVIKGAAALLFRLGARFRTTKDLDLGRQDNEEAATADFLAAQSVDLGDYFTFVIERTKKLDAALEGAARPLECAPSAVRIKAEKAGFASKLGLRMGCVLTFRRLPHSTLRPGATQSWQESKSGTSAGQHTIK